MRKQYHNIRQEILDVSDEVLRSGQIMDGNYTAEFESWLAKRNQQKYAVTCHSGTQALEIMARWYRSLYIDTPKVLIPSMTYPATVNAFLNAGWDVHLADTDDHGIIDLNGADLVPVNAVVMIGLYGASIDGPLSSRNWISRLGLSNLLILEDAAQHWLSNDGIKFGAASAISFDPTKNLNNYGNGGAIVTDDSALMYYARSMRNNGKPGHDQIGTNSRISEIDAAQLLVKARHLDQWQKRRQQIAQYWITRLRGSGARCLIDTTTISDHALQKFVITLDDRDSVRNMLSEHQIETKIHYEQPCHEIGLFHHLPAPDMLSKASALSRRVLSLPIYPELTDLEVDYVVDQVLSAVNKTGCNSMA